MPASHQLHEVQSIMQVSAIQTDVVFADRHANLQNLKQIVQQEVSAGTKLIVFPECFTTGYCFESLEEAQQQSEPMDGTTVAFVADVCHQNQCFVVFGMLEQDGDQVFNVAVLMGPDGLIGSYRKTHLPFLGVDRFTTSGDRPFEVFEAGGVRIGMLICYDGGFPESSRVLSLLGADVVVLPTNWPPGAEAMAEFAINTRAMENGVYFLSANRVGVERGFSFIGRSRICDPAGTTLDSSGSVEASVLRASIDVQAARTKRIVRVPGKHIIDRLADRRPELYGQICEPHSLSRPGRDEVV